MTTIYGLLMGYPTPYGRGLGLREIFGRWSASARPLNASPQPCFATGIILLLVDVLIVFVIGFPANSRRSYASRTFPMTTRHRREVVHVRN